MKRKHKKREVKPFTLSRAECFRPKPGSEFCYLGAAHYRFDKKGELSGKNVILLDFYRKLDKELRPFFCPAFVLRLLLRAELNGSSLAKRVKLFLIKGVQIEWMGWRWEKFRIKGSFTPKTKDLAKAISREIEDASHAGWFV